MFNNIKKQIKIKIEFYKEENKREIELNNKSCKEYELVIKELEYILTLLDLEEKTKECRVCKFYRKCNCLVEQKEYDLNHIKKIPIKFCNIFDKKTAY